MERKTNTKVVHDPEPERYYDWMLWKMRQERNKMSDDPLDSPTDDVSQSDLIGWIEKPFLSKEEMWMREVAEMQKTNHNLMMRVKEQAEEIQKLKEKIENAFEYFQHFDFCILFQILCSLEKQKYGFVLT